MPSLILPGGPRLFQDRLDSQAEDPAQKKHSLNSDRGNKFCKMGKKPGLSWAARLSGAGMQGFVPTVNSWRQIKKYLLLTL